MLVHITQPIWIRIPKPNNHTFIDGPIEFTDGLDINFLVHYIIPIYNIMPLSEVFLTGLYVTGTGVLMAIVALLYKSKCTKVKCCCIEIDRDVAGEEKIDEEQLHIQRNNNPTPPV